MNTYHKRHFYRSQPVGVRELPWASTPPHAPRWVDVSIFLALVAGAAVVVLL